MADNKYFISEEIKGKKRTTIYAIRKYGEPGITVQTIVESLDDTSEPKVSEKYYPNEIVTSRKIEGEEVYHLTGGL